MQKFNTDGIYERLSWQQPERKDQAGKVTVFGGLSLNLKTIDSIFLKLKNLGAGHINILVPESLAKSFKINHLNLTPINFNSFFGLTDSGIKTLQDQFAFSDSIILADLGRNSQTQFGLLSLIEHLPKPLIITSLALDLFINDSEKFLKNPHATIFLSLAQFQKLIKTSQLNTSRPLTSTLPLKLKVGLLAEVQSQVPANLVLLDGQLSIATNGNRYLSLSLGSATISPELSLASSLSLWQIWAPKEDFLSQLFMASKKD